MQTESLGTLTIEALGAFGGWAVVVAALTHYVSDLFAKRTLQKEAAKFGEQLASLGHELKLRESAYGKHLDLLLNYYSAFYRHYRICQNATNQDAHRFDDGTIIRTKDTFWKRLEDYRAEMASLEGTARLLLPASLLELHEEGIAAFNAFKDVMLREKYDDSYHNDKRTTFAEVMRVKQKLEDNLRRFLRTEHMLSPSE